ncbi:SIR2 family protein [Ferruginibacter sp. SUN002]|uniref:SIR2 family protein n=1 Tax=Ferruginibacter sp. SUN002 TaxID=2937789 RepID=UPI003D35D5F9
MATSFILGAGFSVPAKYPSGHTLNEKFFKNLENNILKFSSGEWKWDEYDISTAQNGRLNWDHLNISYLLSVLIEHFQMETFMPFDYEEFYDWINKAYPEELIKKCCTTVNIRLEKDFKELPKVYLFQDPGLNEYRSVQECYSYLIADILNRPYKREENGNLYDQFIELLRKESAADIFTLNHDNLLEYLLTIRGLQYSDGFTAEGSLICNDQKKQLPVFNDVYSEAIKIHKLHGSIDYYQFSEMEQSQGGVYYDTGKYWFFKTNNYWDIHTASLINSDTKEIVQSLNPDIKPQFLTGKSKQLTISEHQIYKQLYSHLKESLATTNKLVIIGYSYRDKHINEEIKQCIENNSCEIFNVNPYVAFPFRRNYSQTNIHELDSISSL